MEVGAYGFSSLQGSLVSPTHTDHATPSVAIGRRIRAVHAMRANYASEVHGERRLHTDSFVVRDGP